LRTAILLFGGAKRLATRAVRLKRPGCQIFFES
jgi:hypothetical protein